MLECTTVVELVCQRKLSETSLEQQSERGLWRWCHTSSIKIRECNLIALLGSDNFFHWTCVPLKKNFLPSSLFGHLWNFNKKNRPCRSVFLYAGESLHRFPVASIVLSRVERGVEPCLHQCEGWRLGYEWVLHPYIERSGVILRHVLRKSADIRCCIARGKCSPAMC